MGAPIYGCAYRLNVVESMPNDGACGLKALDKYLCRFYEFHIKNNKGYFHKIWLARAHLWILNARVKLGIVLFYIQASREL